MKQIRSFINIALGSLVAALGLSGCHEALVKYGVPVEKYGAPYVDTTVHCMYGVDVNIDDENTVEEP